MKLNVGVSKNHIHVTEETWLSLFGDKPMIKRNDLSQPGQFASVETVDLKNGDKILKHVRVVGPFRKYNQVELCETDAAYLNLNPPRRQSGDLENTEGIEIINGDKSIKISSGVILADAHVHISKRLCETLGLKDKQKLYVYKDDLEIMTALLKVTDDGVMELHIDTDEAKLYNLETESKVDVRVCGK